MAYARWGPDSDVYVYSDGERWLCHCGNDMGDPSCVLKSLEQLLYHLQEHRHRGHKVPQDAIDRVEREIREETSP